MLNHTLENGHTAQMLIHDINSSLSALSVAMEVIKEEWRSNPELVDKILPLTLDKINLLQHQLNNFRIHQHKFPSTKI